MALAVQIVPPDLERAVQSLFDVPIGVGITDPQQPQAELLAEEAIHVARAHPARRREFAAGRHAARLAMAQLGLSQVAVPADTDRSPQWPESLAGSISHAKELCIAVISDQAGSLGLDLEADSALEADLVSTVCSPLEMDRISGTDQDQRAKLVFCAKEAVYKAQYPLTKELFGFDHIDVALDMDVGGFTARFLKPAGEFRRGREIHGRFLHHSGHFITGVTIPHQPYEGG